jgi:hypothetical protein
LDGNGLITFAALASAGFGRWFGWYTYGGLHALNWYAEVRLIASLEAQSMPESLGKSTDGQQSRLVYDEGQLMNDSSA